PGARPGSCSWQAARPCGMERAATVCARLTRAGRVDRLADAACAGRSGDQRLAAATFPVVAADAVLREGLAVGTAPVLDLDVLLLERDVLTLTCMRSGVTPSTSTRPPCLRKAARSLAIVSLVMLRLRSFALLWRANRC